LRKVLVISPLLSYPATDGGRIGILYPLLEFSKHFEVFHCFITDRKLNCEEEQFFKFNNIQIFPFIKKTKDKKADLIKNILEGVPFKMKKYFSPKMQSLVNEIISKHRIDFVWMNHAHVGAYGIRIRQKFNIPVYLREHNIEYELVKQYSRVADNRLFRAIGRWQYLKTKQYEKFLWNSFDEVFFISDHDYSIGKTQMQDPNRAKLLYDGCSTPRPKHFPAKEENSLVFSGSLNTFQNLVNLREFMESIMQKLVLIDPRWKLYVTGNRKLDVAEWNGASNVVNAGFVDDIGYYCSTKKYFISPTVIGSGIRVKLLNAMALGMVCFISELDFNSMEFFRDMENVIMFRSFEEFQNKLLFVEENPSIYENISENALKIHEVFTWEGYGQSVSAILY
jgi:glycosyltransferase involved in cell wall biosynthesis